MRKNKNPVVDFQVYPPGADESQNDHLESSLPDKNQSGFSIVEALIILVVIGVIGGAYSVVAGKGKRAPLLSRGDQAAAASVNWQYDQQQAKWTALGGTPPACPSTLFSQSPVDVNMATAVLYPGQYRGNSYTPHGGFRFDKSKSTDIDVRLPMDATLVNASRYIESNETQYLLTFINDCGISFRFDHMDTLTPKFKEIIDTLPPPAVDDSRITPIRLPRAFKAGELVAKAVGFPASHNISMDFGVYDLRAANQISANPKWQELHQTDRSLSWFGVCWFDLLPATDAAKVKSLPPGDSTSGTISDYCQTAAGTTIR